MKKLISLVLAAAMMLGAGSAVTAKAEEEKTYTVGICQLVQHAALDAATQGFMDALTEKLGDNVKFDLQNAQGETTMCSTIVTGFVANEYDLIMANATPALLAAVAATDTIPILGTSVTDYGTALAIDDMDATKGTGINVSGTSDGVPAQQYADTVLELVPDAKNVAVLYCSAEPNSVLQADQFVACMDEKGVKTTVYTFTDSNDIQAVVTTAVEGADAMYIPTDNTAASNMTIISNVCGGVNLREIREPCEIVSLNGTVSRARCHLHIAKCTDQLFPHSRNLYKICKQLFLLISQCTLSRDNIHRISFILRLNRINKLL